MWPVVRDVVVFHAPLFSSLTVNFNRIFHQKCPVHCRSVKILKQEAMTECFDKIVSRGTASAANKQRDDVSICFSVMTQVQNKSEVRPLCTEH